MRLLVLMWPVLLACDPRTPEPPASPLTRERGRVVFREHCVLCHGTGADGHGARSFAMERPPADFTSLAWRRTATAQRVRAVIRDGVRGTPMAGWPTLSADQIDDLTAYVISIAGHGP